MTGVNHTSADIVERVADEMLRVNEEMSGLRFTELVREMAAAAVKIVTGGVAQAAPNPDRAAIEFAYREISDDGERFEFLECWLNQQHLDQWPEFRALAAQPPAAPVEIKHWDLPVDLYPKSAPAAPTGDTRSGERPPASAAMGHSAGADTRCSAGTNDASAVLTEIIDYFATSEEGAGGEWAHPDDFSSYCLDFQGRDGTKFWLDLEKDGTIHLMWKRGDVVKSMNFGLLPVQPQEAPKPTKTIYVKRWRTLINVPEKYAAEIAQALSEPSALPTREEIEKALCCPKGCLRGDGCYVGSRFTPSKNEREQADAIMALLPASSVTRPHHPTGEA